MHSPKTVSSTSASCCLCFCQKDITAASERGAAPPGWIRGLNKLLIRAVASILKKSETWLISATLREANDLQGKQWESLHIVST